VITFGVHPCPKTGETILPAQKNSHVREIDFLQTSRADPHSGWPWTTDGLFVRPRAGSPLRPSTDGKRCLLAPFWSRSSFVIGLSSWLAHSCGRILRRLRPSQNGRLLCLAFRRGRNPTGPAGVDDEDDAARARRELSSLLLDARRMLMAQLEKFFLLSLFHILLTKAYLSHKEPTRMED